MNSSKLFPNLCIYFIFLDITNSLNILDASNERKYKRQSEGFKCILPSYPDNGNWTVLNGIRKPGDAVDISVPIKFQCNQGYRLTPDQPYQVCDEDTWNPLLMPKCLKSCPPLYSTPTMSVRCQDVTGYEISCAQSTDGTYLTYECEQFYEALGRQQSLYCSHGSWDSQPICQPVCGKKIDRHLSPLIFNGVDTAELEYPWIVALFIKNDGKFVNSCGGSLITTRMILTAAHCVTNDYAQVLDKNILKVAAGKYYNEYDDTRDKHAQYREVAELIVHEHFRKAARNFQYDIALIVTKGLFILGPAVQPICIDNINSFHPHVGNNGEIAGWGLTEDSVAADHLKTLTIPYKDQTTCASELPSDWADRYNLDDKICGGFWKQNKSVCRGDSGSGFIFRNPDDNRYYIHGLVSISPTVIDGSCNSQSNVLFTKVSKYYQWLDRKRKKNYVEECTLPSFPKNGMWRLVNSGKMRPGDMVPSNTILEFSCNEGHKLSSSNPKFYCASIAQLPSCDLLCTTPVLPSEMRVSCSNSKQQKINCADAVSGSSMSYSCPDGDETTPSDKIYCIDGSWSNPNPMCKQKERSAFPVTTREEISESSTAKSIVVDTTGVKVICTYASWWSYHGMTPEDLDPNLCTHIVYTYIGISEHGDLRFDQSEANEDGLYRRTTKLKNENRKLKVLFSVGGSESTNASLFSSIAADAGKTGVFISTASNFIRTYRFDGLDIDWYFPEVSDKNNYVKFLESIRKEFEKHGWLLSASVRSYPEDAGYDAPKMNEILDWITIKSYNMYGSWSKHTGNHNALYPSPVEYVWEKEHLNVHATANNWMKAGLTKNKMVLSVAFYGVSFTLKSSSQHSVHAPIVGKGPEEDSQFIRYSEICGKYKDFNEVWDDEQKVSYKYKGTEWLGYNSIDDVWHKGDYVRTRGYFGVNIWPVDGDDVHGKCGSKQILLKNLHKGIGNLVT